MDQSLYDKYGGFSQINRIVMAFYDHLLDSDALGPYFDDVDMAKLIDHQTRFIASLMGGPASFSREQIRVAHRHLSITAAHFQEMTQILEQTLSAHGVDNEDIAAVLAAVENHRDAIVVTS